jgi:hypothetical protein
VRKGWKKRSNQIKIGRRVSYYPGRGSIFVDGESKCREETGLAALRAVLREQGEIRRPRVSEMELIGERE